MADAFLIGGILILVGCLVLSLLVWDMVRGGKLGAVPVPPKHREARRGDADTIKSLQAKVAELEKENAELHRREQSRQNSGRAEILNNLKDSLP